MEEEVPDALEMEEEEKKEAQKSTEAQSWKALV